MNTPTNPLIVGNELLIQNAAASIAEWERLAARPWATPEDKAEAEIDPNQPDLFSMPKTDYDECLACQ